MPDVPATFSCPHCLAPLRLRHRPAGAMHLPCPDCGTALELNDQAGELLVRLDRGGLAQASPRAAANARTGRNLTGSLRGAAARLAGNPLAVTWAAAGVALVLLAVAVLRSERGSPPARHGDQKRAGVVVAAGPEADAAAASPANAAGIAEPGEIERSVPRVERTTPVVSERRLPRPPVVASKPPASPPVDPRDGIAARLSQRVMRFEQPAPVAFEAVRSAVEEIGAVSIRYDESAADAGFREAPVSFALADVSLAEVLGEAARQAGLAHVIDADGVRLVPAPEGLQARLGPASPR